MLHLLVDAAAQIFRRLLVHGHRLLEGQSADRGYVFLDGGCNGLRVGCISGIRLRGTGEIHGKGHAARDGIHFHVLFPVDGCFKDWGR